MSSPYRFIAASDGLGGSYLFVENVARMLGCNVDYVRRIPVAVLPKSRVGQRVIYARIDVEAFIASRRDDGSSRYVPVRKPANRPDGALSRELSPALFDPVSYTQRLLEGM